MASFDIQPARKSQPARAPARQSVQSVPRPAQRSEPVRSRVQSRPKKKRFAFFGGGSARVEREAAYTRAPSASPSVTRGGPSLRDRRKARRKRRIRTVIVLVIVAFIIFAIGAWQAPFRITSITAEGPHQQELVTFAEKELSGTRHLVFPKNSILFVPRDELRAAILKQFPDVEAVSLSPEGLTGLHIAPIARASAFWWCGTTYVANATDCYEADTSGKIFRQVVTTAATTTATTTETAVVSVASDPQQFKLFGTYSDGLTSASPIGATMDNHYAIPQLFRFIKAVKGLGANVVAAQIRGDEADLFTAGGTRITYVLGKENEALNLAATSFPSLDVGGSSLFYIDLRFTSKVYFKRKTTDSPGTSAR